MQLDAVPGRVADDRVEPAVRTGALPIAPHPGKRGLQVQKSFPRGNGRGFLPQLAECGRDAIVVVRAAGQQGVRFAGPSFQRFDDRGLTGRAVPLRHAGGEPAQAAQVGGGVLDLPEQ